MIQFNDLAESAEKIYKKITRQPEPVDDNQVLLAHIREMNQKIVKSEALFNELTDIDLIDYASYDLLASRSRYSYLLKEAKKRNLHF